MTRPLIAGNWKMNGLAEPGLAEVDRLVALVRAHPPKAEVVLCPPATLLAAVAARLRQTSGMAAGGQDCHAKSFGPHTGDLSAAMLQDVGAAFCIIGHSERRADHAESDALVLAKAASAQATGLTAIICVGETLAERDAGQTLDIVGRQVAGSLPPGATAGNTVVAYEPVWAIGTGRTPTAADVGAVHAFIREKLAARFKEGSGMRLLYGGSVKPDNAAQLMAVPNVDGALVGGASLRAADFWPIVQAKG